jgi:hypothetical protein
MANQVLTDPTPVPAGSWVLLGLVETFPGDLNIFQSLQAKAQAWIDNCPATWPVNSNAVTTFSFFAGGTAIVSVQIPDNETIGSVATVANGISNQLKVSQAVLSGTVNPDPSTWIALLGNPSSGCSLAQWFSNPGQCSWSAIKIPLLILVLALIVIIGIKEGWFNKLLKKV